MKRARRQKGSLQKRKQGGTVIWAALWRDESGSRRSYTIGRVSKITKSKAEEKLAELVAGVNAKQSPDPTLAEFIASAYLPAKRREWKESTRGTNEQRIHTHLRGELGEKRISELRRELMASFLEAKARAGNSYSLVAHLRWDLKAILDLAVADSLVPTNQAIVLTVPQVQRVVSKRTATPQQVMQVIASLDIRDRLIARLAFFVGLRPGEICALQWKHIAGDSALIEHRVYRGKIDSVKNDIPRTVALPPSVVKDFARWIDLSFDRSPDAFVFPSEKAAGPGNKDSFWRHSIAPRLKKIGLVWVNFQVMRRTWASLAAGAGIDPKVRADQLGHGVAVDINEYTQTPFAAKLEAVRAVEKLLNEAGIEPPPALEIQ